MAHVANIRGYWHVVTTPADIERAADIAADRERAADWRAADLRAARARAAHLETQAPPWSANALARFAELGITPA